jgi:hypothetical protein
MMGAGWVVNVVVAEWIIRRRGSRPSAAVTPVPRGRVPAAAPAGL